MTSLIGKHELVPIGSRRYHLYDDDSDYNYLLIVPEQDVQIVLSNWNTDDIIEYPGKICNYVFLPVNKGYKIRSTTTSSMSKILGIPVGSIYTVLIAVNNYSVIHNINLYHITRLENYVINNDEMKNRLRDIRMWTKANGIYGSPFPDGVGYIIYAYNSIRKGYSTMKSINMLSCKYMYYYDEFRYKHISHVSNKSLEYMADIIAGRKRECPYQYRIVSNHLPDVLKLTKGLLDKYDSISHIDTTGVIHSYSDISDIIDNWIMCITHIGIKVKRIC